MSTVTAYFLGSSALMVSAAIRPVRRCRAAAPHGGYGDARKDTVPVRRADCFPRFLPLVCRPRRGRAGFHCASPCRPAFAASRRTADPPPTQTCGVCRLQPPQESQRIMLVAAVGIPDEVRADSSLVCIAGFSVCIHADEHHIVIGIAFIKATGLDAEVDQLVVDPSVVQIFDGVGGAAVGLRQKKHLFFRHFRSRDKGGRRR